MQPKPVKVVNMPAVRQVTEIVEQTFIPKLR
jgi:hypothetical protein